MEKPYRFHSQGGEDFIILKHFFSQPLKCGGTFVEMGALDGLKLSISLFFERHLSWKGLLIEPNPENYKLVLTNRPNTTSFGVAASDCPGGKINFTGQRGIGHLIDAEKNNFFKSRSMTKSSRNQPVIQVPCLPLGPLLKRAGLEEIDLFVLDVEGSEYSVLKTMDWTIPVKVWIVEMSHGPLKPIIDIFAEHGYYDSGINFVKECTQLLKNVDKDAFVNIGKYAHHCAPSTIFVRKQGLEI